MKYLKPEDRYDIEDFNRNFREIEERISQIEDDVEMTPEEVYATTRPADWLPMPMPNDDEIYFLLNMPQGTNGFVAFTVVCTGTYTVETGTVVNGQFVSQTSESVKSGIQYETELQWSDYEDLTSDGSKQAMMKIKGTSIQSVIKRDHSKLRAQTIYNVVEVAGKLPSLTQMNINGNHFSAIRYFALYGENNISNASSLFLNMVSLITVLALDASRITNASTMYSGCSSLLAVPMLNLTNKRIPATQMFSNCRSIRSLSTLDIQPTTGVGMFQSCFGLIAIPPKIDWRFATSLSQAFQNCYSLTNAKIKIGSESNKNPNCTNILAMCGSLKEAELIADSNVQYSSISYAFQGCNTLHRVILEGNFDFGYGTFMNCFALVEAPVLKGFVNNPSMGSVYSGCYALKKATIKPKAGSTGTGTFTNCYSLQSVNLDPTLTGWPGVALSFAQSCLFHKGIVELFESLPTITSSKAITLTGNPGVPDLTDADKAIATQKGWTLTL